ncbi:ABC transporter substrate-binding protein [Pseudonocardia sp. KRD291]|uniref:ABC transporter substrate-binding protein n=1 Tax=Pseudonocardia sp. KRD291 TaxID=2792007 RepID=UPI001C4A3E6F|nr:ABC transporter substrate-binding protein [Pseudonocardia sp. KRD291]MBW0102419.1 ABC transporter substrate-binding protein [Pseudonocardia sp. KRD291]
MPATTSLRRTGAVLAAVALTAGLTACGGAGSDASSPTVTFGVNAPELPGSAYYTSVPTALGYWSGQGLDVKVQPFDGSGAIMTAVATDKILVGAAGSRSNFAAHVNGNADSTAFYAYIPGNPYYPTVPEAGPIRTLADLQGRTVGLYSLAGEGERLVTAAMRAQGLDPTTVRYVDIGIGGSAAQSLRSGQVDAYMGYDSVNAQIEATGYGLRRIASPMDDYGFAGSVVARPERVRDDRDRLVKLGRGIAEGSEFARANPECALRVHWSVYPEAKAAGVSDQEALRKGLDEMRPRLEQVFPVDERWGAVTPETVQQTVDVAVAGGMISEPVAPGTIFTPDLLAEINDFDRQAVAARARTCDLPALLRR